jgi:hypothetical protein
LTTTGLDEGLSAADVYTSPSVLKPVHVLADGDKPWRWFRTRCGRAAGKVGGLEDAGHRRRWRRGQSWDGRLDLGDALLEGGGVGRRFSSTSHRYGLLLR